MEIWKRLWEDVKTILKTGISQALAKMGWTSLSAFAQGPAVPRDFHNAFLDFPGLSLSIRLPKFPLSPCLHCPVPQGWLFPAVRDFCRGARSSCPAQSQLNTINKHPQGLPGWRNVLVLTPGWHLGSIPAESLHFPSSKKHLDLLSCLFEVRVVMRASWRVFRTCT